MQHNLFALQSDWHPPEDFPELDGIVGLDFETRDPKMNSIGPGWAWADLHDGTHLDTQFGYPVGVALAWGGGHGYWPTAHANGGNMPGSSVYGWLREQAQKPNVTFVVASGQYEAGWLRALKIKPYNRLHDVQLMAPLLNEHRRSYGLDALSLDYLGKRKDETLLKQAAKDFGLKHPKSDLWQLPATYVGPYAEQDAVLVFELFAIMQEKILDQGLQNVYDVERELIDILVDMRCRGVRVDLDETQQAINLAIAKERDALASLKRLTNLRVDPWSGESCAMALRERGISIPRTANNKDSVTKEFLETSNDEVATLIREARRWNKCHTTFLSGHILRHSIKGRIHCQFHSLRNDTELGGANGTVTQRFSSSDPNLQQLPSPARKDPEIGFLVRKLFKPEEGEEWHSADYKSQEPKLICHFAELAELKGAKEACDRYRNDKYHDFYAPIRSYTGLDKHSAKTIVLGLAYGMGDGKLCHSLGYETEPAEFENPQGKIIYFEKAGPEGKALLDKFDEVVPFIRKIQKLCKVRIEKRGFLVGLDGARFRPLTPDEYRKGLNKLIQGSAARQMKRAMLEISRRGMLPNLLVTVHDELGLSGRGEVFRNKLTVAMEEAVVLRVPSTIDLEVGPSWGDAK